MNTLSRFTCNDDSSNEDEAGCDTPCGTPTNVDRVERISEACKEPCEQSRNEESNKILAVVPVSVEVQETFLQNLFATLSGHFLELTFSMAHSSAEECRPYLLITQKLFIFILLMA